MKWPMTFDITSSVSTKFEHCTTIRLSAIKYGEFCARDLWSLVTLTFDFLTLKWYSSYTWFAQPCTKFDLSVWSISGTISPMITLMLNPDINMASWVTFATQAYIRLRMKRNSYTFKNKYCSSQTLWCSAVNAWASELNEGVRLYLSLHAVRVNRS